MLAENFAKSPETILNKLVELAVELCGAGTAGISLEETASDGQEIFRWVAMAGALKQMLGGSTPRRFSPCGVCVDTSLPQLFSKLGRYYTYFQDAPQPFAEALLIPWKVEGGPVGTIWIVAHKKRNFDREDLRLLNSLADFAAVALRHQFNERTLREHERLSTAAKLSAELAHQINNPLQAVVNALAVLKREKGLTAQGREFVGIVEQETQKVAQITSDILTLNVARKTPIMPRE